MLCVSSSIKRHTLFLAFISFLLFLILLTYKGYGVAWDEKVFFNTGKYFVVKLFEVLNIPTNLSTTGFEPTSYHILGHGVFMDMLTVFAGLLFPNFNFETLHLIRALFALPIFILLYWIVSRLTSKVYGLLSVVFLLLFPRFYPEIYYNAVDIPTMLLFTLSLAYFIYYASSEIEKQKSSRPARTLSILKSILFGAILGVTINQRLLLFYLPLLNFVFLFFLHRKDLKQLVTQQLAIFVSLFFFLHLTHPYLLTHPITGLFDIVNSAKQYPWNAAVLFDGQFYQAGVNPLPWYYLPKSMLITIPLSTLFLFILGNLRIFFIFFHSENVSSNQRSYKDVTKLLLIYFFPLFYIPFLIVFVLKPTLYDSWRHFMFLTVPLIIIAVFGLHWIIDHWKLIGNLPRRQAGWKLVIGIFIFINLLFTVKKMIILHPYEYLYYNSLVGGLKGAYRKYETDYWGLGYKEAALWFNKNVNNPKKQYKIFVEGDPLSSTTYFKPNMQLTININDADYIFTFTRWNFHVRHPGKTIYTVKREGIPLIVIKKP